ncbi:MAG: hypothetical protein ACRD2B_02855 [Terriglobia bacterium]
MDVEKTMQFILEMQAKHEVTIQQILETQAQHRTAIRQSDEQFARFREQTEERFRNLVDVCLSLARHGEETDRRFRETDYKLNALIDTVDKLIKRNGHRE